MEEKILQELLDSMTPSILGGMLDTIVKALNIYPTIQLEKLYRMADFTRWGCAIAEALNLDPQLFLDAYEENVKSQSEETLKASLPATVLIAWMDLHPDGTWKGAPEVLYNNLCDYADELKISTRQKAWPKSATWFFRRLNDVKPSLYTQGYRYEHEHTGKSRIVTVWKTSTNSVNSVNSVKGVLEEYNKTNAINAKNAISQSYTPLNEHTGTNFVQLNREDTQ
jgi:hypothetical protein